MSTRILPSTRALVAICALPLFGIGCNLVAGLGGVDNIEPAGAGGSGGASNAPSSSSGAGCVPDECALNGTDCQPFGCDAMSEMCVEGPLAALGEACTNGSGNGAGTCDGEGSCIPNSCRNGVKDFSDGDDGETDIDCGGICSMLEGGKCLNGKGCVANTDCQSNKCKGESVCEPCETTADCLMGDYCNLEAGAGGGGVGQGGNTPSGALCELKKSSGESCGNSGGNEECSSGDCSDGLCVGD